MPPTPALCEERNDAPYVPPRCSQPSYGSCGIYTGQTELVGLCREKWMRGKTIRELESNGNHLAADADDFVLERRERSGLKIIAKNDPRFCAVRRNIQ